MLITRKINCTAIKSTKILLWFLYLDELLRYATKPNMWLHVSTLACYHKLNTNAQAKCWMVNGLNIFANYPFKLICSKIKWTEVNPISDKPHKLIATENRYG